MNRTASRKNGIEARARENLMKTNKLVMVKLQLIAESSTINGRAIGMGVALAAARKSARVVLVVVNVIGRWKVALKLEGRFMKCFPWHY